MTATKKAPARKAKPKKSELKKLNAPDLTAREYALSIAVESLVAEAEDIRNGETEMKRKGQRRTRYRALWKLAERLAARGKLDPGVSNHEDYDGA